MAVLMDPFDSKDRHKRDSDGVPVLQRTEDMRRSDGPTPVGHIRGRGDHERLIQEFTVCVLGADHFKHFAETREGEVRARSDITRNARKIGISNTRRTLLRSAYLSWTCGDQNLVRAASESASSVDITASTKASWIKSGREERCVCVNEGIIKDEVCDRLEYLSSKDWFCSKCLSLNTVDGVTHCPQDVKSEENCEQCVHNGRMQPERFLG
ncbi:hypothetical protein B0H13DRAFT_561608 [Mycena leptocephala]|nr:hypothetical protein B0H13DRAFT_561608 [Mycena leptocephala]